MTQETINNNTLYRYTLKINLTIESQSSKGYMLFDSAYIAFLKGQSDRDKRVGGDGETGICAYKRPTCVILVKKLFCILTYMLET